MGGTFDMVAGSGESLSTSFGTGTDRKAKLGACTLLGPEGPGRPPSGGRDDLRTRFTFKQSFERVRVPPVI